MMMIMEIEFLMKMESKLLHHSVPRLLIMKVMMLQKMKISLKWMIV